MGRATPGDAVDIDGSKTSRGAARVRLGPGGGETPTRGKPRHRVSSERDEAQPRALALRGQDVERALDGNELDTRPP